MNMKACGVVLTACSVTLGGHASLIAWSARIQQRVEARTEVMVTRVVRDALGPMQADVQRAHSRIDSMLATRQQ
jgi:hypothetical protein